MIKCLFFRDVACNVCTYHSSLFMAAIAISHNGLHASAGRHSVHTPRGFGELTPAQMRKIFRKLFTAADSGELRVHVVKSLILDALPKPLRKVALYDKEVLYELSEQLSFLWNETSGKAWFSSFNYRGCRYFLPGDNFHYGSLIEFIYADQKLQAYAETQDIETLNELVAILCRPTLRGWWWKKYRADKHTGDCRERFNATICARRAKTLANLAPEYKTYVLRYFVGCKLAIMRAYPSLFPDTGVRTPDTGLRTPVSGSPWLTLLKDVASTQLYGDYDKTAHYNLHTILTNAELDAQRRTRPNA